MPSTRARGAVVREPSPSPHAQLAHAHLAVAARAHQRVDLVDEDGRRRVVARELEEHPHELLGVAAPLRDDTRRRDVEEGRVAL
eukprot:4780143-Prymnesium_polylepis.1